MIRLRIHVPDQGATEVTVEGNQAGIGRANQDVTIPIQTVSTSHARIFAGVVVADLGSLNGVWVKGNRIEQPTILEGGQFTLGGDARTSPLIEVLDISGEDGEAVRLRAENDQLKTRIAALEGQLGARASAPQAASQPDELRTVAAPPRSAPVDPAPAPAPAPEPAPVPVPVPAPQPTPPATSTETPSDASASSGGLPSFEAFFGAYRTPLDEGPPPAAAPAAAPPVPAKPVAHGATGNRQAVLSMIDRLIREDVGGRDPLMDGPVEEFFTLESFRLLRQVEKVITRLARDFVQLYEMKTMLPGQEGNFRSMAADVLVAPDDQHARQKLVSYLDDLCRWLGVALAANRHAALKFLLDLKRELTADDLVGERPIPVWMKAAGQEQGELWRRAQRRLNALTDAVAEDRIEQYVLEFANQHMERRS